MKIAFIVGPFPKLSETFILNQITGLIDLGHDVQIFAWGDPLEKKMHSDIEKYHLMERVHYFTKLSKNRLKSILIIAYQIIINFRKSPIQMINAIYAFRHMKSTLPFISLYFLIPFLGKNFDIIQCHFGPNGNIGAYLKQMNLKGKLVIMFHGYDIRSGIEKGGDIYKPAFIFGDCFLSISDYNQKNLINFGLDPKKIIFHPVGIDINRFSYKCNSTFYDPKNTIKILTVGRLVEEKGIYFGIHAISKLLKMDMNLNIEYNIVGEGKLENELKELVRELNLDNYVHFYGPREQEEINQIMQNSHIFLLPSIAEALPVVLMEAQAVGLPVVTTHVGSIYQVVVDGKSGFLVPEKDSDALAEKIYYLIKNPELRYEMGLYGRRHIENNYDVKRLNLQLDKIYRNLIQESKI